jgi:aspartate/methionine/tyrosine aminotransferase
MRLPPFQLERYFARHEFAVRHLLCASDCASMTVRDLLALEPGSAHRLLELWLGYTESQGSPPLRRELCRLYETIGPEDLLVHSGAEEAIYLFMQAVLEPGDHVVVHWPCYQSLVELPAALGCEVSRWEAREKDGWTLDPDELRRLLRPRTRLLVLNIPHNPTGYLMPRHAFQEINDLVRERGILLFSDEVYRELEHDPGHRLPAACDLGDHAVSLGVMSKAYGLAGLRIGWVATRNRPVLERMAALKDYTTICNSAPSEFLAEVALRHREAIVARNLAIIVHNMGLFDAFVERHAHRFAWRRPTAGPIAFPRLLAGDTDAFCRELEAQAGVLLLPGSVFAVPGPHFRMGFGRADFAEGLERLEAFVGAGGRGTVPA